MKKTRWILTAAAALLAGSIFGASAEDKAPVRIGTIAPLSGPGAFDGQLAVEGMEAMADDPPADASERGEAFIRAHYDRRTLATRVEDLLSSLLSDAR